MGIFQSQPLLTDLSQVGSPSSETDSAKWRSYDYIIVGGGTAGCVLASRLSQNPNVSVLVIEAGKSNHSVLGSRMPLAFTRLFFTAYDWSYETSAQPGLNNRKIKWPRGKMLGGSSSINACLHHHSSPEDYNQWEKLGATGWNYDSLKPYFIKAEQYRPSEEHPDIDLSHHGTSGLWQTSSRKLPLVHHTIVKTCEAIGIPYRPDFNTKAGTLGAGDFIEFVDQKGERSSIATAYLNAKVLARPNLTVLVETATEKIIFSETMGTTLPRAVGIQMSKSFESPKYFVAANKEVLLCAGVVATPQILMISGIGPKAELEKFNIRPISVLEAVGRNLSDHISAGGMVFPAKPGHSIDYVSRPWGRIKAALQWFMLGTGPMSHSVAPGAAFFRVDNANLPLGSSTSFAVEDSSTGPGAPDAEVLWFPLLIAMSGTKTLPKGMEGITLGGMALQPKSTGIITLSSTSAWDKPSIDANYLQHATDLHVLLRIVRLQLKLANTDPLNKILDLKHNVTDKMSVFWPGDANPETVSDQDLIEWIKRHGTSAWHPVGSARMGGSPEDSVADPDLRVYGVEGLRICDASVFPQQVSGHPCAVVVAVAEKLAASMISYRD